MNPSVSQMNIFSLPLQCIGRAQRGHLTSAIDNRPRQFSPTKRRSKPGLGRKRWVLDYSGPVDLLVLPRVASKFCNLSKAAGCATFLADMVGVSATSPTPDVSTLSAHLSQRCGSFATHLQHFSRTLNALKDKRCTITRLLCEVGCQLTQYVVDFANRLQIVVCRLIVKLVRRNFFGKLAELSCPDRKSVV